MYLKGQGVDKNDIEQYAWWYVAAHSTPQETIEKSISKMAKLGLKTLEFNFGKEKTNTAKKHAQEYFIKYGNQPK